MKVLMIPSPEKISGNRASGIDQVVLAYARHLPDFGVELVSSDDNFDLIAAHAGLTGEVCDVAHLHGLHWSGDYDAPEWEYKVNERIVAAVRYAKTITVPSEWVAETIRRDLRVNPTVIPHGISWADWQHAEPRGDYVLWNKNRADPYVCDAAPVVSLARNFTKMHFVTTFLPRGTEPLNNVNAIGLIPHDQMKKLLQSAAVYLATTKETFGIGILEAMASGVPVLGYGHGGILDLVQHGINGWLAAPGDLEGLAEGLRYCLKHRKTLGANGVELAKGWTWQAAVAQVAEVYRRAGKPEPPTVGVVIPIFNKTEDEFRRAVESVTEQSYQPIKIVIVDDGSTGTDDYERVVSQYMAGRAVPSISIVYRKYDNRGVAVARNRGIEQLESKYVCCLDGDDWLEPDFLRVCVEALEADRSLGVAYTGLRWHKPDGTTGISEWPGDWDFDQQLQRKNQVPTCCLFRRVMWERLGGYRQRYAPGGAGAEDAEFWLRAGAYGFKAAKVTGEALFNYSWLSGRVTGNPEYKEVDWTGWHPWTRDKQHPFASYARPSRSSHAVRAYDKPAVSVIIPVGPGHEHTVIDALDSLEAQTFRKWECIVVWDNEGQVPQNLLTAYPYVNWIGTEGGKGAGYARNRGAEHARAPLLLFLDADDWLYPEALHKMTTAWNANQAIVYTDYVGKAIVDDPARLADDLQARLYHYDQKRQEAVIGYRAADFDCERAIRQPELPQPFIWCNVTAIVPEVWHEAIGGFDESMESWEDVDYHWRLARAGYCYHHLPQELLVYRFYTGSRRDQGLQKHKNLVQYIRHKYAKEENIVGCRGCPGGGKATSRTPAPAAPVMMGRAADTPGDDSEFLRVRYVLPKRGSHEVIASTAVNPVNGLKFSYGWHSFGDVFLVHRADVWMVEKRSGQQVLRDPGRFQPLDEDPVKLPASRPVVTPPPVALVEPAFDPQTLPGINARVAQAMLDAGLDSREAIVEAGIEGLVAIPGIGEKKAGKIVEYLSR